MSLPWFQEGVRFGCTGCGKCCQGEPGYVFLTIEEMEKIADFLKITFDSFTRKFVRQVGEEYSLIEIGSNNACIFLKDNACSIYENRPKQCRTFPFWGKHLASKDQWNALKKSCEGIHDEAPLISIEEIQRRSE